MREREREKISEKEELNPDYWQKRYIDGSNAWDAGDVSTPLKNYFGQLSSKETKILIPGAGNGYEAEHLFDRPRVAYELDAVFIDRCKR